MPCLVKIITEFHAILHFDGWTFIVANDRNEPTGATSLCKKPQRLFPVGSMPLLNADFLFYFSKNLGQIGNSDNTKYFFVLISSFSDQ
jgi:hypothetical protein